MPGSSCTRRWEMFYAKEIGEISFMRGVVIGLHYGLATALWDDMYSMPGTINVANLIACEDYIRDPLSFAVG